MMVILFHLPFPGKHLLSCCKPPPRRSNLVSITLCNSTLLLLLWGRRWAQLWLISLLVTQQPIEKLVMTTATLMTSLRHLKAKINVKNFLFTQFFYNYLYTSLLFRFERKSDSFFPDS